MVDGRIVVQGPRGRGHYAAVIAGEGMRLVVNGEVCRSAAVREGDRIEVVFEAADEVRAGHCTVTVSADRLTAELTVTPGERIRRRLADSPFSTRLELTLHEERVVMAAGEDGVRRALAQAGVVYGIDMRSLARAAQATEPLTTIIARGDPPGEPAAAEVVLEVEPRPGAEGPLVQAGWRVATIRPGRPGKDGRAVTGEALKPGGRSPAVVVAGDGVRLVDGVLYAQVDGRFMVQEVDGEILCDVVPLRIVPRDMDGEELVSDTGDVLVRGSVFRSRLQVAGFLEVEQGALQSVLTGGRGVAVGRVVSRSVVQAGAAVGGLSAYHGLRAMAESLETILATYEEIARMGMVRADEWRQSGLRPLIDVLLRRRLAWVPQVWRDTRDQLAAVDADWTSLLDTMGRSVLEPARVRVGTDEVEQLLRDWRRRLADLESRAPGNARLQAYAAHRSRLFSEGSIWIERGAEESELTALGPVASPGSLRGGRVWSATGVAARELGSPMEMRTEVAVARGAITAGIVHPGVTVSVGGVRSRVDELRRNCRISLRDGRLVFDDDDADRAIRAMAPSGWVEG
ncbi:MAG: DUF342 domain-containing protein [Firmicutes bacterium]|nr:DUF342 domain-containing protein [Bacillota bacterium]